MEKPDLDAGQRALLETTYAGLREAGTWPRTDWVDTKLDHSHGISLEAAEEDIPSGLMHRDPGYGSSSHVRLTVAGLAQIDEAQDDCECFVALVRLLADRERAHDPGAPDDPKRLALMLDDVRAEIWPGQDPPDDQIARVLTLIQQEGLANVMRVPEQVERGEPIERIVFDVDRSVRPYRDVASLDDYLARRPKPRGYNSAELAGSTVTILDPAAMTFNYPFGRYGAVNTLFETSNVAPEPDLRNLYAFILKDQIVQACEQVRDEKYSDLTWDRADDITAPGRITDQITAAIDRADVVIADLTGNNPNVMFEVGYAVALNRPLILLNQTVQGSPFDIQDWRQITYSVDDLAEARKQLIVFLDAVLRRVRDAHPA